MEATIVLVRQLTGWGPRLIAGRVGVAHSTVHIVLRRAGLSRPPGPEPESVVRTGVVRKPRRRLPTTDDRQRIQLHANASLAAVLADNQIRHLTTKPYGPQTNGKVERFHQTMAREWGYGMTYLTDRHRARALTYWLDYYNERRPRSALDGQPPTSRVRNLPGHDS